MIFDNRSVGLVFSGGGGKGSYQIGVWRALEEFGVSQRIGAVAGTSVGALNAVLFKQGNVDAAERIWLNLTYDDVLQMTPERIAEAVAAMLVKMSLPVIGAALTYWLATHGFFSHEGLKKLIERHVDWDRVTASDMGVHGTAVQVPLILGGGPRHFSLVGQPADHCRDVLLASSAIPVLFPRVVINGKKHIDGGIPFCGCNTPVEAIADQGHRIIIAVLLDRCDAFDVSRFPNSCVLPVFPQEDLGNFVTGVLDFDGSHARRRIRQGYEDTKSILEPVYRMGQAQLDFDRALSIAERQQAEWRELRRKLAEGAARLDQVSAESSAMIHDAIRSIDRQ